MPRSAKTKPRQHAALSGLAEEGRPFVYEDILRGIGAARVKGLIDHGVLEAKEVFRVIPERTFNRRLAKGEALKTSEADAIGRLLRLTQAAEKTFGDTNFAHRFLRVRNPALKNQIPIEMAATDAGAREVEAVLTRIAYGDYS